MTVADLQPMVSSLIPVLDDQRGREAPRSPKRSEAEHGRLAGQTTVSMLRGGAQPTYHLYAVWMMVYWYVQLITCRHGTTGYGA